MYVNAACSTSAIIYGAMAFLIGLPCLLSCTYRTKLRSKYDLVEAPAPDWVTHFFCEWCALCQEYRELRAKGLQPELGKLFYSLAFALKKLKKNLTHLDPE